jgi:hypothetical protein
MKNFKFFAIIIALLSALFLNTCDWPVTDVDTKSFDKKLRGIWVSNDPGGIYSGSLKITSDTITIDGYREDQTSQNGDDSKRPFKDIPKGKPFKGYSEDGKIFFKYGYAAQDGIPYVYTEGGKYPQEYRLLEFSFGDRKEILEFKTGF